MEILQEAKHEIIMETAEGAKNKTRRFEMQVVE